MIPHHDQLSIKKICDYFQTLLFISSKRAAHLSRMSMSLELTDKRITDYISRGRSGGCQG